MRSRATAEHARGPRDWRERLDVVVAVSRGDLHAAELALRELRGRAPKHLERELQSVIDGVQAQRRRWTELDAVARALQACDDLEERSRTRALDPDDDGQVTWTVERRPVSVSYHGRTLLLPGSRWQVPDRRTVPADTGADLARCGRSWFVTVLDSGELSEQPYRCGSRLCPDCVARSAWTHREDETAALTALATAGASIIMATATGRTVPGTGPVVLDPRDLARWPELAKLHRVAGEGRIGTATGGAPLALMLERVRSTWRALQDSQARDVVELRAGVIGGFTSWEATARASSPTGKAIGPLRWHPHCHALISLFPDVDPDAWADLFKRVWCRLYMRTRRRPAQVAHRKRERVTPSRAPFAAPEGQDVAIVHRSGSTVDASEIRRAVAQVVKYAGALDTFTGAAAVEFAAATKGLHLTGQPNAGLHSATRTGAAARYAAAAEMERSGIPWTASDLHTLDELRAPLARYGIADEPAARADLTRELGTPIAEGLIRAWRALLGDDLEIEPDDERPPAAAKPIARIVARDRGRWVPVTRARLAVWSKLGRGLLIAEADLSSAFTGRIVDVREIRTISARKLQAMIGRTAVEPPAV